MELIKKHYSNVLFGIAIILMLYTPTRIKILSFISLSPSIESVEDRVQLTNYNWQLKGVNTANLDFNDAKGKVVLVNFWATTCAPCVAEMPSIQDLYSDYGDKMVFVLATHQDKASITPFLKERGFTLPIYNSASSSPGVFETRTIPRTFLLNKKGEIVVDTGRADWNSDKIRAYIDELLAE